MRPAKSRAEAVTMTAFFGQLRMLSAVSLNPTRALVSKRKTKHDKYARHKKIAGKQMADGGSRQAIITHTHTQGVRGRYA